MSQSQSNQKPKPGDLIEISRGFYQHWAVYIGDGLVVHMVPPSEVAGAGASSVMSVAAQRAVVKKEKLSEVVGTNDWRVNNDLDEKYNPHQTDIIVKEALQLVGTEQPYDIGRWNCEHFAKKLRYGKAESRQSNQKPKPGDLIEISRGFYQHWAVYIGDGLVVHMVPPSEVAGAGASSVMSVAAQRAVVKKEKLSEVVGTDDWRVNNDLDEKYDPHQTDIIVKEALQLVGTEQPYDIGRWNCEHFAKKLRYGKAESRQVRNAMIAGGAAAGGFLGIAFLAGALSGWSKKEDENTQ